MLATADSEMFTSLRRRPTSRAERYAMGRSLRQQVPRRSLGDWTPPPGRPDPVELIIASHGDGCVSWCRSGSAGW